MIPTPNRPNTCAEQLERAERRIGVLEKAAKIADALMDEGATKIDELRAELARWKDTAVKPQGGIGS